MSRAVTFRGPSEPGRSLVNVPIGLLHDLDSPLKRADFAVAVRLLIGQRFGYSTNYKSMMSRTGYKKAAIQASMRKLTKQGYAVKLRRDRYTIKTKQVPCTQAYSWELELLAGGCSWDQIRLWATVKLNEGITYRRSRLAELSGVNVTNVSTALTNYQETYGLYDLQLVRRIRGRLYSPTAAAPNETDVPSRLTSSAPRARATRAGTPSQKIQYYSLSFRFKSAVRKTLEPIIQAISRGALRARGDRGSEGSKIAVGKKVTVGRAFGLETDSTTSGILSHNLEDAGGDPAKLLLLCPWTAQMGPKKARQLLREAPPLHPDILFKMVERALEWLVRCRHQYSMPFPFLTKWLRGKLNIQVAARLTGYGSDLDPLDPGCVIYRQGASVAAIQAREAVETDEVLVRAAVEELEGLAGESIVAEMCDVLEMPYTPSVFGRVMDLCRGLRLRKVELGRSIRHQVRRLLRSAGVGDEHRENPYVVAGCLLKLQN